MKLGTSFSGLATETNKVIESYHPQEERLFDDRFALDLLPPIHMAVDGQAVAASWASQCRSRIARA